MGRQAAGFGWSFRSGRCGGFANTDCSAGGGGAGAAVATGGELPALLHDTDMDEKRGDDDDVLALSPLIDVVRKCSDMGEVVDHYMDLPYPPRDPADEQRRIVMDPNNTPIAISHHLWGGTKVFPKAGSSDPPFRLLIAGGGTGDATVMFGVTFVAAGLKFEIVHLDLSQASIDIATERVKMHAGVAPHVRFIRGSLLEVGSMGLGKFDFISACAPALLFVPGLLRCRCWLADAIAVARLADGAALQTRSACSITFRRRRLDWTQSRAC